MTFAPPLRRLGLRSDVDDSVCLRAAAPAAAFDAALERLGDPCDEDPAVRASAERRDGLAGEVAGGSVSTRPPGTAGPSSTAAA